MRNLGNLSIGTVLAFALIGSGCSTTPKPSIGYDEDAQFEAYQTFSWAEGGPVNTDGLLGPIGSFVQEEITSSVSNALEKEGIARVDSAESSDLSVLVTLGQRDQYDVENYVERVYVYAPRPRRVNAVTYVTTGETVEVYSEGSISIDIFDNEKGYRVWYGHVSDRVERSLSASETEARIRSAIELLLADFPPSDDDD